MYELARLFYKNGMPHLQVPQQLLKLFLQSIVKCLVRYFYARILHLTKYACDTSLRQNNYTLSTENNVGRKIK